MACESSVDKKHSLHAYKWNVTIVVTFEIVCNIPLPGFFSTDVHSVHCPSYRLFSQRNLGDDVEVKVEKCLELVTVLHPQLSTTFDQLFGGYLACHQLQSVNYGLSL